MILAGSVPSNTTTAAASLGGHTPGGGLMSSSPHSHVALISAVTPSLGFSLSNGSDVQPSLLAVDPEEDSHHSYHHGMHMSTSPHHHHLYHHHHHHHDYHHHAAAAAALLGGFTSGSGGVGLVDCVAESNNCADREDSTGFISVAGTSTANSVVGNYCLSGGVDSVTGLVHSVTTATSLTSANDGDEAGTSVESGSINDGSDSGVLRSNDRSVPSSSSLTVTARTAAAAAAAVAAVSNHHHHLQQLPPAELSYHHHHHHRTLPMDVSAL
ncbi:midnolin homolog [Anopheles moucheti]|uniref:midnolin homolog n=1 Tax=Anopheles moucheti TaxID=186751 RepID=UPI0022F00506|nr:midnolin homolog [Anopheles moucheti]